MPSDLQSLMFRDDLASPRSRTVLFLGEFSSGKSSLINSLIGRDWLRTRVTATQVPTVELRYGNAAENVLLDHAGTMSSLGARDPLALHYDDYVLVRLHDRIPVLKKLSLIDTPGISDPRLPTNVLKACAESADVAIWCTHASQAWRESERATWQAMPERLRSNSLLVVTRSDQLSSNDRTKLAERLAAETDGLFGAVLFVAVPVMTELLRNQQTESTDWIVSGGAGLFEALGLKAEDLLPEPEQTFDWFSLIAEQDPAARRAQITAFADHYAPRCADLLGDLPDQPGTIRDVERRIWEDSEIAAARSALGERDVKTLSRLVSTVANAIVRRSDQKPEPESDDARDEKNAGPEAGSESPVTAAIEDKNSATQPHVEPAAASDQSVEPLDKSSGIPDKLIDPDTVVGATTSQTTLTLPEGELMATDISELREISGFVGACLVDSESGLMIGSEGGGSLDLEMAAAGNTDFLRSKQKVMSDLGLNERIEDILITLGSQIHLIRPLEKSPTVFLYLALDKAASNLGMARIKLRKIESSLEI